MTRYFSWIMGLWITGAGLAGMAQAEPARVSVVATVGMVADLVRGVAGEQVLVDTLIGEGIDPHLYKPTRADVLKLSKADMIFYNGLLLEGKMADVLGTLYARKPVTAVAGVLADSVLLPGGTAGHHDPHVWMDVDLWSKGLSVVVDAMSRVLPDKRVAFTARAEAFREELVLLDAYVREVVSSIPPSSRVLITAHDAFGYFGRAYGIEVLGIQGISTESEAGLNDINRLVDLLVRRNVRAIFVETSVADKNVRALIEGARARGHDVVIGGSLFSDAMGAPGSYEGTYIGMMDHNASTIARALGGSVPEGGYRAWKEKRHDPAS